MSAAVTASGGLNHPSETVRATTHGAEGGRVCGYERESGRLILTLEKDQLLLFRSKYLLIRIRFPVELHASFI